jgi:hypothetical protein
MGRSCLSPARYLRGFPEGGAGGTGPAGPEIPPGPELFDKGPKTEGGRLVQAVLFRDTGAGIFKFFNKSPVKGPTRGEEAGKAGDAGSPDAGGEEARGPGKLFVVLSGGYQKDGKPRVNSLESGKAEVGDKEIVFGKMFPQIRDKLPFPAVQQTDIQIRRLCTASSQGLRRLGAKPGLILRAEADQYPDCLRREGARGGTPPSGQGKQGRVKEIGRGTSRRAGEEIQEKIKAVPERAPLVDTQDGAQGRPESVFLRGGLETVQNDQAPGKTRRFLPAGNEPGLVILPLPQTVQ